MRGVGGKRWSGAAVVQAIWKKFLFQLTYRIAEHLKYSLVKISVCKLINSMSIMVYNCKLRHPWTTFCLLYMLYSCSCYGDGILFTLNIVPLARCVFLMLFVKKKKCKPFVQVYDPRNTKCERNPSSWTCGKFIPDFLQSAYFKALD